MSNYINNWPRQSVYPNDNGAGIDLRAHFALVLMQGLLARHGYYTTEKDAAELALKYADALIDALNKEPLP